MVKAGCGFPTCVQINSQYFENVTTGGVPKIIDHLKSIHKKFSMSESDEKED